ncbi:MAG: formyltetrahydrofolate deformylase [Planctomycetota bacterium]
MSTATLRVSCPDRTGLVAALSDFVFRQGGNIIDLDQHSDADSGTFFMRLVFDTTHFTLDRPGIEAAIAELARTHELTCQLTFGDHRPRIAVFCTKVPHCLYDLLLANRLGDLSGDIAVVVSNHSELEPVAAHFQVPFVCIAGDAAEREHESLLARERIGLVVLARYMQILSPAFVTRRRGQIINIHHSFLPAFVGARPYHQAKERGVKLIGATAHYVTEELDQGPIIEQAVAHVSHRDAVEDMIRKGRELERQTLTRAVRLHLEHRVLINGNRTVVFA